jgi:DNA-binding protein HU-beta
MKHLTTWQAQLRAEAHIVNRSKRRWAATATACTMLRQANLLIADLGSCFVSSSTGVFCMAKKSGAPTKSDVVNQICKDAELSRKQVAAVFASLNGIIKKSLRGHGMFTLPGLLKMKVVKKPATKARQGINPFTKEQMMFKAKPASKKIRLLPLKSLKALVN